MLSLLESLRRLIRQDTNRVGGPVGNMYGTVTSNLDGLNAVVMQSWTLFDMPGSQLPEIESFYQMHGILGGRTVLLVAQDGTIQLDATPGTVQLLRSMATIRQRTNFNLRTEVTAPGGVCAVYVDGTLIRRGQGVTLVPISMEPGSHEITVITTATMTRVTAPLTLELNGEVDIPAKPTWIGISTAYMDQTIGTAQNTLTWVADPKVGGYYVLRRQRVPLQDTSEGVSPTDATVVSVGEMGADGAYAVTLEGFKSNGITAGAELLAEFDSLGIVVQVLGDDTGSTSVRCRKYPGMPPIPSSVVGQYAYLGTFSPIANITRTSNAPTLSYTDTAVSFGEAYEYALVAYGLVNPAMRSPRSDVRYVVAGDIDPPGSIVFDEGYPTVEGGFVTARFTTPPDLDYAGVNVYWLDRIQNEASLDVFVNYKVAAVSGRTITVDDPELPPGALVGYQLRYLSGPRYEIESNTNSTITVKEDFLPPPEVNDELEIFRVVKIKTDFGKPASKDELTFTATEIGRYAFCSFDRAGNEQSVFDGAIYDLLSLVGTGFGTPVVAFRQLIPSEQSFFAAPYNSSTDYAIVELWCYNEGVPANERFEGMELYYRRRNDDSDRLIIPIPYSAAPFPWIVSGSLQAVLDQPNWVTVNPPPVVSGGIKSRYVSLERGAADNWIRVWAENAAGFSTDILTFVVDFDTNPEITSLETYLDNDSDAVTFQAIIDDDTQAFTWYVDPALPAEGSRPAEPTEASPNHVGSKTIKTFVSKEQIMLPLGTRKTLYVKPYGQWKTDAYVVASVTGKIITLQGSPALAVNALAKQRLTYAASTYENQDDMGYTIVSNTANTITVRETIQAPLPTNGTTIFVSYATGLAGEEIKRELVRTPRSFVSFENKNAKGERDVNFVTATFSMTPTPVIIDSGAAGTISESSGFTLTDNSRIPWVANTYMRTSTSFYYLRMKGANDVTLMWRIVSNTTTQLVLEGGFRGQPAAAFSDRAYEILDGAVMVQYRAVNDDGTFTPRGFNPTVGKETYARADTFYLDYYATKNGCEQENLRSILVDPDTDASFQSFVMDYIEASRTLMCIVAGPDDDCKYWELYLKKGGYPTVGGTTTDPLDAKYLRYISSDVQGPSLTYSQNVEAGGTWYGIAVPYNSFNQPGKRKTATRNVDVGTGGGLPGNLTGLTFAATPGTNNASAAVSVQNGAAGKSLTVTAYDNASPGTVLTVNGTFPPANPNPAGEVVAFVPFTLPFQVSSTPTTNLRTWTITATLTNTTGITPAPTITTLQITRTFHAAVGVLPPGGATPSLTGLNLTLFDEGYCPDYCQHFEFRPLSFNVEWMATNADPLIYTIEIEKEENGDGNWVPVMMGIEPTTTSQVRRYNLPCTIYRSIGVLTEFKFRVKIVRLDDGTVVATGDTPNWVTKVWTCPRSGTGGDV